MEPQALFVKMALLARDGFLQRTEKLFDSLSDAQLEKQIAPGKNTGRYLLGHLIAVHDGMIPLLRLGERVDPSLDDLFLKEADNPGGNYPSVAHLRAQWKAVHQSLQGKIQGLTPAQWFERHNSISEEDFAKEPHRNRLSIMLSRTSHLAWHYGQVLLLKP